MPYSPFPPPLLMMLASRQGAAGVGGGASAGPPTAPTSPRGRAFPLVNRDPKADRRTRQGLDPLAQIVNELLVGGYIERVGQGSYRLALGAWTADRPPTATDDSTLGLYPGAVWVNTVTNEVYIVASAAEGAAVWKGPI